MTTTLLQLAADLNLSLAAAVSVGATTATLTTAVDSDGVALPSGKYGFTVDGDNSSKEFFVCDLVGTALTNVQSISKQGATTTGFDTYHRTGAIITITDWAILSRILKNLTAVTGFDSGTPLKYDGQPTLSDPTAIPTVQFVLDEVNGGPVTFNATVIAGDAGETIVDGDWVYFDTSDGEWYKTDADITAKCFNVRIGKARGAGTNGNTIVGGVFIDGLETVGTYVAGTTYYLSNTAGALSTSAGTNSVVVGVGDGNGDLILRKATPNQVDAMQGGGSLGTPSTSNKFLTENYIPFFDRFGDGSDGAVTISAPTTLTRDMYYSSLTVNSTLDTDGYRIFVQGTLNGSGTIQNNGNAGGNAGGGPGAGGAIKGSGPFKGRAGSAGGITNGGGSAGSAGSAGLAGTLSVTATAGGAAGNGSGGQLGGAGGAAGTNTQTQKLVERFSALYFQYLSASGFLTHTLTSGGGGGAGGSNGGNTGGNGGGSGSSGGVILIFAQTWAGTFTISSTGGAGGTGGTGGGGGGGGGGAGGTGGTTVVVYGGKTWTGSYTLAGGTGGTGGTGSGGGANGSAGSTGSTGISLEFVANQLL